MNLHAQTPGSLDMRFNPNDLGNGYGDGAGTVRQIETQSDGKILLRSTGLIQGQERPFIARLQPDGSLDESFDLTGKLDGNLQSMAVLPNDKILIVGDFTKYEDQDRRGIALLNADGSLDTGFEVGEGVIGSVYSILVLENGKILIGGNIQAYDGQSQNGLTLLNADGSLDSAFDTGTGFTASNDNSFLFGNAPVHRLARARDGKIIVVGQFAGYQGVTREKVVRLHPDGRIDLSFDPGSLYRDPDAFLNSSFLALEVQEDDKVLIAGMHQPGFDLAFMNRLNADGSNDPSFTLPDLIPRGLDTRIDDIAVQPDGKILLGGVLFSPNSDYLTRLNPDGSFDESFAPVARAVNSFFPEFGNRFVFTIKILEDGNFLIGGIFKFYDRIRRENMARIKPDGTLDESFYPQTGFDGRVNKILIQDDQKIVVGGQFGRYNGKNQHVFTRLQADGDRDSSFLGGEAFFFYDQSFVQTMILKQDGRILAGGECPSCLSADGQRDNSCSIYEIVDFSGTILDPQFARQEDGKVLIIDRTFIFGFSVKINGNTYANIARMNPDGSLDTSFEPAIDNPDAIALQSDGKILLGKDKLYRLFPDGSLDPGFNTFPLDGISNIWVQEDDKILIAENGEKHLIRLNADGSMDNSFLANADFDGKVLALAIQPDGKIIVGGEFSSFNGRTSPFLIRLLANGQADPSFELGTGPNDAVRTIAMTDNQEILVGGDFTAINGTGRNRMARLFSGLETAEENPISFSLINAQSDQFIAEFDPLSPDSKIHLQSLNTSQLNIQVNAPESVKSVQMDLYGQAIRLMMMGDSNTSGDQLPGAYRTALYNLFQNNPGSPLVDFVGRLEEGDFPDNQHEGRRGRPTEDLINLIAPAFAANQPDVLVLQTGTVDLIREDPNFTITEVEKVLNEVDRYESESGHPVVVLLAQIINRNGEGIPPGEHAPTQLYNQLLANLAQQRIQAGDQLHLVNLEPLLDYTTDLFDEFHPNEQGYQKMAQGYYEALLPILETINQTKNEDRPWQLVHQQVENIRPFALFGDDLKGDFFGRDLGSGHYRLEVRPFSEKKLQGIEGATEVLQFQIIDSAGSPEILPIRLINAEQNLLLDALGQGAKIDLAQVGTSFLSLEALRNPAETGSVSFNLTGPLNHQQLENLAPYTLFGDGSGNYEGDFFPLGAYQIEVVVFAGKRGSGEILDQFTLNFSIQDSRPPRIESLSLMDSRSNQAIGFLEEGMVLDISQLDPGFTIRANPGGPVASVKFELFREQVLFKEQIENVAPYALFGDSPQGNYTAANLSPGDYQIKVSAFGEKKAQGAIGGFLERSFKVVGGQKAGKSQLASNPQNLEIARLYRNPIGISQEIQMNLNKKVSGVLQWEVVDLQGQIRARGTQEMDDKASLLIQVQDQLPTGTYVLRLEVEGQVLQKKLLKY